MSGIELLFDRMDAWRHLPAYQLERRADLFFSLYIPEVLEAKLGFAVKDILVPEFPVRIGTIYPNTPINKSFKIDYVAISEDGSKVVLVELKTEGRSRREGQDKYLLAAQKTGMADLLGGILDIFRATTAKRKYFCLQELLSELGQLRIPEALRSAFDQPRLAGVDELSHEIEITSQATECDIVYIQPNGCGDDVISFDDMRKVVANRDDPVSRRFAQSLTEWANTTAGAKRRE